jgi:hypothetical protein
MSITRSLVLSSLIVPVMPALALAQDDLVVNGYTYVAPSIYPVPPVVVYDPFFAAPTQTVIVPAGYYSHPVVYSQPAFVSQAVAPGWNYVPAPRAVRARARPGLHGMTYTYHEYAPGRAAPVYSYRVNPGRYGVRVRQWAR